MEAARRRHMILWEASGVNGQKVRKLVLSVLMAALTTAL